MYSHIPKIKRKKWDAKSEKGYFIEYEENIKGFRVWFPHKKQVNVVRDLSLIHI